MKIYVVHKTTGMYSDTSWTLVKAFSTAAAAESFKAKCEWEWNKYYEAYNNRFKRYDYSKEAEELSRQMLTSDPQVLAYCGTYDIPDYSITEMELLDDT